MRALTLNGDNLPFIPPFNRRGEKTYSIISLTLLILILSVIPLTAQEATFPRYPAVSPDGEHIAFGYAGDIWTVPIAGGRAYRLTVHEGYEHTPRWSPDGNWIAFSGNRDGDDDVYVIPSDGGQARRLTFFNSDDKVCDWRHDNSSIIFSSRRDDRYPDYAMLYTVPIDGGTPTPFIEPFGHSATVSNDGKQILYTRKGMHWWRKHYRGSGKAEIWLYNMDKDSHIAITDTANYMLGDDFRTASSMWALWGSNRAIYVVSDSDGTFNLWKKKLDSWTQITHYVDDGIRFPSISKDGLVIAYEQGLDIFIIDNGEEPRKLNIIAPLDDPNLQIKTVHFNDKAGKVEFSTDEKQIFFDVRGELFASRIVGDDDKAARGRANSISGNDPARDHDFTVSPGGDSIIFVSDRDGSKDLYLAYSDDSETTELSKSFHIKLERLTSSEDDDHNPQWSPDGDRIAFIRGKGDIYIISLKDKKEKLLLSGWSMLQYQWSPDGKWIAYAREDDDYNSDVFIIPSDGGKSINVSRHPDEDDHPVWSPDGKKLGFRSRRRQNNWDIYYVYLSLTDHQKKEADWAEEQRGKDDKSDKDDKKDKKKKKKEPELVIVTIDTTDIYRRIRTVTHLSGEEGSFTISPDGETFVFTSDHEQKRDLYSIKWNGKDLKRLTEGGINPRSISFDPKGKRIRYLTNNGRVKSKPLKGSKAKSHPFDAYVKVDVLAEREQKFDELWRTLNDQFYDGDFHGQDWNQLYHKYRHMIDKASCEVDFGDIVNMMFGELNASHMGYRPIPYGKSHKVGRLGLTFDNGFDGKGFLVIDVLLYSPCALEESKIEIGERLLSINGILLDETANLHQLLDNQENQPVELLVADRKGKKERRVIVKPMGSYRHGWLSYDRWVKGRRAMVEEMSDRKLGYLHVRGMGDPSLARFEAQLFSVANGKEGLVIDVRYNGGGWITDQLLAMLQVKRHGVTYPRDGGPGYPQGRLPLYSWTKPIIVLCNEHSFSNAEIFSHAIKTLGRGTLVGVPTPGGVISTGGNRLVDDSGFRIPLRGWYTGTGLDKDSTRNMEGNGAVPDIIVPLKPGQMASGDDKQLETAISELLIQLETENE